MAKVRIPKRVAGVKIPKKVRRRAKKAVKLAESPALRELAAAALGAAAQAKADRATEAGADGRGRAAAATLRIDGDKLARAIRAAALDGIRRFLEGFEEGLREATSDAGLDEEEGGPARGGRRRPSAPSAGAGGE